MIRVAVVGLGKMGLSHLAILRAHPKVELVAACDGLSYLTNGLERYAKLKCYNDLDEMLRNEELDAVLIATPSSAHASMVEKCIAAKLDIFCEKPFVLNVAEGQRLVALAEAAGIVTQVGYHYRFVSTFGEAARIVRSGQLGRIHHVRAEAHGPVVLRAKGATWRSRKNEGGGVIYDYACHAIDLVHFLIGPLDNVSGVIRRPVFSHDVDDEVYCSLHSKAGINGQLSVNWSDESCRKMVTKVGIWGENGSIKVDRQECVVFLRKLILNDPRVRKGWTTFNTTEANDPVWFYLRGEEYSRQIDHFVQRVETGATVGENDFASALQTDRIVAMIHGEAPSGHELTVPRGASAGLRAKLFGRGS